MPRTVRQAKTSRATSTLMAQAHGTIKKRILRGDVRVGDPISRRQIAEELGMSFLPVSLALLRLEYEGFVESRPRAGTRVRIPSREEIRGHYVVREALEVQSARLCAAMATDGDIADLNKLAVTLDAWSGKERGAMEFIPVHQRFHQRIASVSRCHALEASIAQVLSLESTWLIAAQPWPAPPSGVPARRHQALVDVLARRDPNEAADGMREHIAGGVTQLMKGLSRKFAQRARTYARARTER